MPLELNRLVLRTVPNDRIILALLRSRFVVRTAQKSSRARARTVAAALLGRPPGTS